VRDGLAKTLWEPSEQVVEHANITAYRRWLTENAGVNAPSYEDLWRWSVTDIEDFWESVWKFFRVDSRTPYYSVLDTRKMPGARWFRGAELNYSEHVFRQRDPAAVAIVSKVEEGGLRELTWGELEGNVGAFAASLEAMGVGRGDRVAAYLPNVPESVVAFLACSSIGAIWSSCAPDFGSQSAIDRFKQVTPRVLITTDGYQYRGKWRSRTEVVDQLRHWIPSIEMTVVVGETSLAGKDVARWEDLVGTRTAPQFEQVPFDHPLWIVYSSGTTGLPKPIVHGHGGMLLEQLKVLSFHNDLTPKDRMFWYTSTGWMMWNYLVGSLLLGSTIVLYDGDPLYPDAYALWDLAERTSMTFLGASAAFVAASIKAGAEPGSAYGLKPLRGFGSTGSALAKDGFDWVYSKVKGDIWLASLSGGTDVCTTFVGGCPILPVREGEIQCRHLGASVMAYDELGRAVVDEMGELVVTQPMTSMPLYLWGDESGERYRESYFAVYPGVWRHGDWIRIGRDGSCVIYGRSDATIKRMGVRMGTSEMYRVVEAIPQITDSLVVDMEFLGGRSYMPLFVVLREDAELDDALKDEINARVGSELSPKMVPDEIIAVAEVPRTLSGKKLEVPVRRILLGADPGKVFSPGSLKNPDSMSFYIEFARGVRK
jgi:acetoacetyl-CoA synthetase